ncbi:glycoside hydrolase domain-containing protein [Actinosynnema sp. NPDC051121]
MAIPIAFGADWSERPIFGDVLSRYRYVDDAGAQHRLALVLRYADFPGQQHAVLTAAEYESHMRAGIASYLIYQRTTRDPDGGEPRGREYGRAAVAYARRIGYRTGNPIFATADAPIGSYNLDVAEGFFRGFAAEVRAAGYTAGGYGFRDVIHRLQDRRVVDVLWLCGAESGWRPGIALYQWNNGRIYPDGVEADLVKQFEPIGDDMSWNETLETINVDGEREEHDMKTWIEGMVNRLARIERQVTPNLDGTWAAGSTTGVLANDVASTYQAVGANLGANLPALLGKVTTPDVEIDAEDITRLADELRRTLPGDVANELGRRLTTKDS